MTPSTAPRPPALSRKTPRSFEADDPAALKAALLAQGARELPAPLGQSWRLDYAGGLLMAYNSGCVVVGGPSPAALADLLDQWAAATPPRRRREDGASLFDLEEVTR